MHYLKLFINISDVDENNGPLRCIKKTYKLCC